MYSEGSNDEKATTLRKLHSEGSNDENKYSEGSNDEQDGAMGMTTRKPNNDGSYDEHVVMMAATITSKAA